MSVFDFERQFFSYLDNLRAYLITRPLTLGGVTAVSGGAGGPPGGFVGMLPQTRVSFDLTEAESNDIPVSGASLVDNLNRIRYRIKQEEDKTLIVESDGTVISSDVTVLNFINNEIIETSPGEVQITFSGNLNSLSDVNLNEEGVGDILYNSISGWTNYPLGITTNIINDGSNIIIGDADGNDYISIENQSGEMRLVGEATAWEDLRISGAMVRLGSTAPTLGAFGPSGGLKVLRFESSHHDEIHFEIQMPHAWKEGTYIYPHVHWTPVNTTTGNVVWELEYAWTNINGTFGAPSSLTSDATAAGGTAWVHKVTPLKDGSSNTYIDGTGKTISSMLVCRLHRNAGSGSDTLASDVAFLEFDIHYEVDSFGSDEEYTKNA